MAPQHSPQVRHDELAVARVFRAARFPAVNRQFGAKAARSFATLAGCQIIAKCFLGLVRTGALRGQLT